MLSPQAKVTEKICLIMSNIYIKPYQATNRAMCQSTTGQTGHQHSSRENRRGIFFFSLASWFPPPGPLWNLPALFALGCDSTLTSGLGFLSFDLLTFLNCKVTLPMESSQ